MQKAKVLILATQGVTTNLLYNSLAEKAIISTVILENAESKKAIIKRRIKKLGVIKTVGQISFMLFVLPFIKTKKERVKAIINTNNITDTEIPNSIIKRINSVHDLSLIDIINTEKPTLIFVNGTRILKQKLLQEINCPIVNIHVGITPKYRGVHGGYWALYNNEPNLFGVTLHYIDKGIDTGQIIAQQIIKVEKEDNFKTYPVLQYCAGINLIQENFEAILNGETPTPPPLTNESNLYYHPTIWNYIFGKG